MEKKIFNLKQYIIDVQENRCTQEQLNLLLKYCGTLITNFYVKLPITDSFEEGKSILFEIFIEINIHNIDEKGINEYIKKMMETKISKKMLEIYKKHNYILYENLEEIIEQNLKYNDIGFEDVEYNLIIEKILGNLNLEEFQLIDLKYNKDFTYKKISDISNSSLSKIYRTIKKIQKNNLNSRDLILP